MSPIIATTFCPRASPLPAGAASTVPAASIPGTRGEADVHAQTQPELQFRAVEAERLDADAHPAVPLRRSDSVVSRRLPTGPGADSWTARTVPGGDVTGLPSSRG